MTDESVVTETKEDQVDASEAKGAQDETLEELLSEWDEGAKVKSEPEPGKLQPNELKEFMADFRKDRQERQQEQTNRAIAEAVSTIKKDMETDIPDDVLRWMLSGRAGEDARLRAAWMGRDRNPDAFQKVLKGIARDFSASLAQKADEKLSEDREAVAAAVRGASTRASTSVEVPDFTGKSDQEFEAWVRSQRK